MRTCGGWGLERDGRVDGADLGLLLSAWGSSDSEADLDGSGLVDGGGPRVDSRFLELKMASTVQRGRLLRYTPSPCQSAKTRRRSLEKSTEGWRSAKTSDRHELYELSVQNVEGEIDFVEKVWEQLRDRKAHQDPGGLLRHLRGGLRVDPPTEDNTAVGVDLSREVLDWGRERNLPDLTKDQIDRLEILEKDVRSSGVGGVDSVLAMNFSYFLFKTRKELLEYFKTVRESLVEDGIFICDAYGGSDSFTEMEEERHLDGFTYVWDQNHYNPDHWRRGQPHSLSFPRRFLHGRGVHLRVASLDHSRDPGASDRGGLRQGDRLVGGAMMRRRRR